MVKKSSIVLAMMLAMLSVVQLRAQEFTTEGREFWFGFLENTLGSPPDTLLVSMSSRFTCTATISIPLNGWTQTVNIPANTSVTVGVPRNIAMASGCGTKSPKAVRISATERISAYALNFQSYSADATLLIPNTTLGDKYYLNTYRENYSNSRQTQMLVVAAYPNTTIEITPRVATSCGNAAGVPYQVNMNQGEVYFLDAAGDLTGTFVRSVDVGQGCKKFVLLSGSFCTAVGNQCCCDHLFDVNFYTDSWGKNFILPNLATRGRTRFRVVAQANGTQLSVNNGPNQNLNAGQFYEFDLTAHGSLTSNQPIEVLQLSMSGQVDNVNNSDPFMINLGPNEQTLNEITFNTLFNSGNNPRYYVTIVTKTANTALLRLDGNPVAGFVPVASNNAYSVASPQINFGSHTIVSDSGFLAYVYEYASYESFGYSAGANLSNLFARFEFASADFDTIFCPGDTVNFTGIGDPSIISYEWDFGDGGYTTGQFPKHVYDSLGRYEVKMLIQRVNSCDKDTIPGALNIVGPTVVAVPDYTICKSSGAITISTTPTNPTDTVKWSTGEIGNSITVNPQVTTEYFVFAVSNKCPGIRDTFTVNVFDPQVDFNTGNICFGNPITFFPSYLSGQVNTFQWSFGDGGTSALDTAVHLYTNPGNYNVRLVIVDSAGCRDTVNKTLDVNPVVNINVSVSDVCFGQGVQFINSTTATTGGVVHEWQFGDGNTSTQQSPVHLYADTGTYQFTYIAVATGGCSDTLRSSVRVFPQTQAAFTAPNQCLGIPTAFTNSTFTGGAATTYQWNFGDGNTSTQENPTHNYTTSDTFNVTLISITPQGCNDTATQQVIVFPRPMPSFESDSACHTHTVTFANNSAIQWGTFSSNWSFGDGNTSALPSPTHLYADTGNYSVKLVLTSDNGCTDSITKTARIHPNPTASFTVSDVCNDSSLVLNNTSSIPTGSITYNWNFGDGNTATNANPSHKYTTTNTFNISVVVTSAFGCADTADADATIILGGLPNFTAPAVCEGFTTVFTDSTVLKTGTTVNNFTWTFGDGNGANTQNTSHVYAAFGTYNAKLVLDYGNSCFDSISKQVVVHPNPTAAFTVSDVCNDSSLVLNNTSSIPTGSISYNWNFGDGNTATNANPSHKYTTTNTFNISVVVTSAFGCADTADADATIILGGLPNFTAPAVCEGFTTVFTDSTVLKTGTTVNNYTWTFGDGNGANTQNTSHVYAAFGTYNAKLVLDYGNGCFDSISKPVTVFANPSAAFNFNTVCELNYTEFTNLSQPQAGTCFWSFGDGNTSTDINPRHLYADDGIYNTTLIVTTPDLCRDTISQDVTVLAVGTAAFSVAPVCFGFNSVFINQTDSAINPVGNYAWTFGDNSTGTQHSPVKIYAADGNYSVRLIANFANGCADTTTGTAVVYPTPVMSSTSNNISCFSFNDGNITLNALIGSAPFNYQWNNGASTGALNNIPAGQYGVTFTDARGCVDSLRFTLTQPDSLSLNYFLDSISCTGLSDGRLEVLVRGGTIPYTYNWSNGVNGIVNDKLAAGNYGITVTDANLCELIRLILLPDPPKFTVSLPLADTINLGESITLSPYVPYSTVRNWVWTPATALDCNDCENPVSTPYNDIVYTVYALSEKGCRDSAFTRINVEHTPVVYVPNMFSPNGDGVNDVVMVYANQVRDLDFLIFNRWGEKVYEGHSITEGWNGIYKGTLQEPDAYVYLVNVTFLNGRTVSKSGSVTLVK